MYLLLLLARERGRHGGGAAAQCQVALGGELRVRADDHAAGDAEIGGERARRRQLVAGGEPARADQGTELRLELQAERPAGLELEREKWSGGHGRNWPFPQDHSGSILAAT